MAKAEIGYCDRCARWRKLTMVWNDAGTQFERLCDEDRPLSADVVDKAIYGGPGGLQLHFLVLVLDETGNKGELVSCTIPEGGLGYVDERFGSEYYIVATESSRLD